MAGFARAGIAGVGRVGGQTIARGAGLLQTTCEARRGGLGGRPGIRGNVPAVPGDAHRPLSRLNGVPTLERGNNHRPMQAR